MRRTFTQIDLFSNTFFSFVLFVLSWMVFCFQRPSHDHQWTSCTSICLVYFLARSIGSKELYPVRCYLYEEVFSSPKEWKQIPLHLLPPPPDIRCLCQGWQRRKDKNDFIDPAKAKKFPFWLFRLYHDYHSYARTWPSDECRCHVYGYHLNVFCLAFSGFRANTKMYPSLRAVLSASRETFAGIEHDPRLKKLNEEVQSVLRIKLLFKLRDQFVSRSMRNRRKELECMDSD